MLILIKLLTRLFVKNSDDVKNPDVRASYGNMSGTIGIILNLFLFTAKLITGILSASISVIADAFNNLSDAGSSVVTFLGFKLANRPPDREHPFGHGRYEYVAGLGISVVILFVGIELLKGSIEKIFNSAAVTQTGLLSVFILIVSVALKLWMYFFNKAISKKIDSAALNATALDSLTDSAATAIVLIGLVISKFTGLNIDGYLGIVVALFILFTGVSTFRDSLSPLLGNSPDPDFVDKIRETVLQNEMIVGIHDLMVHDYGPGRCIISLHAEVPCDADIIKAHDAIDLAEKTLERKFNCMATIHMDPIATKDSYTVELMEDVAKKMCEINPYFKIHDFRVVRGDTHTNVIFDLVVPYENKTNDIEIRKAVTEKIREIDPTLIPIMQTEKSFIE